MDKGVLDSRYGEERRRKPHLAYRYKLRALMAAEAVKTYLPYAEGLDILDLGAADGLALVELSSLLGGGRFTGVEASPSLVRCAANLAANVCIVEGDASELSDIAEDGSCDAVCALALLEHLPDPSKAVQEVARVLRKGGLFIATCPNPFWDTVAARMRLLPDDQHEHRLDESAMKGLLRGSGLDLVSFQPFMWAPVGFLPYLRIPVAPGVSLAVDRVFRKVWGLNRLFVNQCLVARKA